MGNRRRSFEDCLAWREKKEQATVSGIQGGAGHREEGPEMEAQRPQKEGKTKMVLTERKRIQNPGATATRRRGKGRCESHTQRSSKEVVQGYRIRPLYSKRPRSRGRGRVMGSALEKVEILMQRIEMLAYKKEGKTRMRGTKKTTTLAPLHMDDWGAAWGRGSGK